MLKRISVQGAVGTQLAHDITEIRPGERIGKKELAFFGHGGLCQDCPECVFPNCAFGKGA